METSCRHWNILPWNVTPVERKFKINNSKTTGVHSERQCIDDIIFLMVKMNKTDRMLFLFYNRQNTVCIMVDLTFEGCMFQKNIHHHSWIVQ